MKINKKDLKTKILQVLDIAPYLKAEELYLALMKGFPLSAIEECLKELKAEAKLDEEYEWE